MITINDEDKDDYNHDINKTKNDNSNVNWYTFVLLYCKSFNRLAFSLFCIRCYTTRRIDAFSYARVSTIDLKYVIRLDFTVSFY